MSKFLYLLLLIPAIAFAQYNIPGNIKIISLSEMDFPESIKKQIAANNLSIKIRGYIESDSTYPRTLIRMSYEPQMFFSGTDQENTRLRNKLSELKLNFKYQSIFQNRIGFSPLGLYTKLGWAGIKEFLNDQELGVCALSVFNVSKVDEPMELNEDGLSYDVNEKVTRVTIEGSYKSGFVYSIRWFDENFVRDFECARMKLDKTIIAKMIDVSRKIDKQCCKVF